MLPACTSTQKPYGITSYSSTVALGTPGYTASETCRNFAAGNGGYIIGTDGHMCQISTDPNKYPVVLLCQPQQKISLMPFDMTVEAAGQIAVAIAAVWATAWVIRTLAGFISSGGNSTKDET